MSSARLVDGPRSFTPGGAVRTREPRSGSPGARKPQARDSRTRSGDRGEATHARQWSRERDTRQTVRARTVTAAQAASCVLPKCGAQARPGSGRRRETGFEVLRSQLYITLIIVRYKQAHLEAFAAAMSCFWASAERRARPYELQPCLPDDAEVLHGDL